MKKCFLLLTIFWVSLSSIGGQDVHFTQFTMAPLMMNPAQTGAFHGSYRIGGIYRDQWAHLSKSFQTSAIYLDAPVIRGFRANDWIGVGINYFQDQAGVARLQFGGLLIAGSYHLALDKKRKNVVTVGFGGGRINRRIDMLNQNIKLEDELLDPSANPQSIDRTSTQKQRDYIDLNAGVLFTHKMKNGKALRLGVSLNHLNKPEYRLRGGSGKADRLPMRLAATGEVELAINDKWSLTPAVLINNMAKANEIQTQALAGYNLNPEKEITLLGGLGFRFGDAIPLIVGAQWKTLRLGVSWDYNISPVTPNGNGGFELAAAYIVKIQKKPKVKPAIICPRI